MWLTIKSGKETGTTVQAAGERFVIGRDDRCDLVLDDEKVSRTHAYLKVLDNGDAELHDLESSNGTFVALFRTYKRPGATAESQEEFPAFRGDGTYSAQIFAGPKLRSVSPKRSVEIG